MDVREYQSEAARTLINMEGDVVLKGQPLMGVWCALGLIGEAGEVAEEIKKGELHHHGVHREKLFKELGDVMWYLAGLCTVYGLDLESVLQANIDKLRARYPSGFNYEDSILRRDTRVPTGLADRTVSRWTMSREDAEAAGIMELKVRQQPNPATPLQQFNALFGINTVEE